MSRRDAALDIAGVIAAIAAGWALTRLALYPALGIADNFPAILRSILGFAAAWALLRGRNQRWSSLGLRVPADARLAIAGAVALYAVDWALGQWAIPALAQALHSPPQPSFLAYIHGNVGRFLLWLVIGWTAGAFIEEALFRGFLLTRVSQLFATRAVGLAVGVIAQALLFGSLHLYAGAFAFIDAATFALASGVFYLAVGRNLWPLIAVHGLWNTIAMWIVYSG